MRLLSNKVTCVVVGCCSGKMPERPKRSPGTLKKMDATARHLSEGGKSAIIAKVSKEEPYQSRFAQ